MTSEPFYVELSLQLPRDRVSVPLIRHLVAQAMGEVGVVEQDVADVGLAVTEAAANVIDHAGTADAYRVTLTLAPTIAELRVVDVGRGFDFQSLAIDHDQDPDGERGRGPKLMQALVDRATFESNPEQGTIVRLVKQLHFDASVPAARLMLSGGQGATGPTAEPTAAPAAPPTTRRSLR
jgi:serine/threonine-protein kinase RsbW